MAPEPVRPPGVEGPSGVEGIALTGAATLLPASPAGTPARPHRLRVLSAVGVLVVVVAVVILAITLGGGGGSKTPAPQVAARAQGHVPQAAVFAASNASVSDSAGVAKDALDLLHGRLAGAAVAAAVRGSLVHPPAAPATSPTLAPGLPLADPRLPACLADVTGGAALFGIDRISYSGQPSLLVVAADPDSGADAFGYVLGTGCALPGTGIRTVVTIPLTGTS